MIKRHQNSLLKKVADMFIYFCFDLKRSDILFCEQNKTLLNKRLICFLLMLWNKFEVKVR